jgi:hypothetical protein
MQPQSLGANIVLFRFAVADRNPMLQYPPKKTGYIPRHPSLFFIRSKKDGHHYRMFYLPNRKIPSGTPSIVLSSELQDRSRTIFSNSMVQVEKCCSMFHTLSIQHQMFPSTNPMYYPP